MIYLSPQGRRLDQALVLELVREPALVLLAGRYEGIDERLFARHSIEEVLSVITCSRAVSCRRWCCWMR
jgi:tRNA (guanine37-N1)-methyltransferase